MPPQRYEIYRVDLPLGNCGDARPWIVTSDVYPDNQVTVYPLSSQFDLFNSRYFIVSEADPAFEATGLTRRCFIMDDFPMHCSVERLDDYLGRLSGNLLAQFRRWAGDA